MVLTKFYSKTDETFICYYLESIQPLNELENQTLKSILDLNLQPSEYQQVVKNHQRGVYIEVGPKLEYMTPWCSQALMVIKRCNINSIIRIEKTSLCLADQQIRYDRMTQMIYPKPLDSFGINAVPKKSFEVSPSRWNEFNQTEKLGFDQFDLNIYRNIWKNVAEESQQVLSKNSLKKTKKTSSKNIVRNDDFDFYQEDDVIVDAFDIKNYDTPNGTTLKKMVKSVKKMEEDKLKKGNSRIKPKKLKPIVHRRVPSDVELYDLSQSNSEHSRHWLFRGKLELNQQVLPHSLMDLIKEPLKRIQSVKRTNGQRDNSLIAMKDNSSAIKGYRINYFQPLGREFEIIRKMVHPIFTAETHNFPTGIAPFPGAATGTGGRIRDIQAMGRGGLMVAGTAGYCIGNLRLENDPQPWEPEGFEYPHHRPSNILIEASNGASDYGNKIGEPLIQGFCRSFGLNLQTYSDKSERIEWVKPIMFSGGVGQVLDDHVHKIEAQEGWLIVRLGGPAYRIGLGGGAASSRSQGELDSNKEQNQADPNDFNAVQRDDPEMENRLNKVIRSCIELGVKNPILSIHDQGAGGMANVTKEIVSPKGGLISLGNVHCGDNTMSAREKWVAEYQEQNTILIHPRDSDIIKGICKRENLPYQFVGFVSSTGRIQVYDPTGNQPVEMNPVDLDLNQVLENVPDKTFKMDVSKKNQILPKPLPLFERESSENLESTIAKYLGLVFRLVSVGSKRFLTNKVDRSVGGLVVQQQTVGPLQTPLADVAVVAQSFFSKTGIATSVAEQPIKGLLDPVRMARLTVGEMLTNLIWAPITKLSDVKCSGNWMWEKKYSDEIYALYQAVKSVSTIMQEIGIAIDGGKDSLSMSARVKNQDVLCPRSLVLSAYVTCPDITKVITPDLKKIGNHLVLVDLGKGRNRLGGSSIAQVMGELGEEVPDLDDVSGFVGVFRLIQSMMLDNIIISGHDRSDGGLITTLVEMAIAGNLGFDLEIKNGVTKFGSKIETLIRFLFSEELGLVIEVAPEHLDLVIEQLSEYVPTYSLGKIQPSNCRIQWRRRNVLDQTVNQLRQQWEETSFRLEMLQCKSECVEQERTYLFESRGPRYSIPKETLKLINSWTPPEYKHRMAIIREEGSNGDREMAAAFHAAGFQVSDITTQDLLNGNVNLDTYRGLAFVGGFSFADVLGAGRAWYLSLMSDPNVVKQLTAFRKRRDTFSLGICNGCQLMAELGWIPGKFVKNESLRFESRWSTVKVLKSNSVLLKGLEGMRMGIWVAHGEGRYNATTKEMRKMSSNQRCLAYVDDTGSSTEKYPTNPNGSPHGLTGLCSADGRHLAMMPHPERSFLKWQSPYLGEVQMGKDEYHPWMEIFRNAWRWCENTK